MESIVVFLVIIALLGGYFLPTIVAKARGHHQSLAIFMVNLLAGWTIFFWFAALIWACTAVRHDLKPA